MNQERKNRTSKEITGDLLVKRLTKWQLAQLLGIDEFRDYHPKIIKSLEIKNDLGLDDFRKVHSSNDCEIEETDTDYLVRGGGTDIDIGRWSVRLPLKKIVCNKHEVFSIPFVNHYGKIYEGHFTGYRELKK